MSQLCYDELDPVKLLYQCNLSRSDLAEALGVEKKTLDAWCCGFRNPSKSARRLAAELYHRWKTEGRYLIG